MNPSEQRGAVIALSMALADAKATGNQKLWQWAIEAADRELLAILPDAPPKPTLADFEKS